MEHATSGVVLGVWQGWGVLSVIAALTALLATILGWLLPFPDRSLDTQLGNYHDRVALRDRLGAAPPLQVYLLTVRRFSVWLAEWFGPPMSGQAFERCLAIAFIIPIILFLGTLLASGLTSGKTEIMEAVAFGAGVIALSFVIIAVFNNLLRFIERMWNKFGGDKDLARTIATVLLGGFAMMVAFTIAFAIATTFSDQWTDPRAVLGAMAGGFAVAVALAVAFALAGAAIFALVVAVLGGIALAFASQFAFLLFLFFIVLPVINACMDWLSWGATRYFLGYADGAGETGPVALRAFGALAMSFVTGALLMIALTILLPNALELVNTAFAALGVTTFDWKPLMHKAMNTPFTDGLFVTGMLMTTLVPACSHLVVGLSGPLCRYTPGARTAAESIGEHMDGQIPPNEVRPVKLTLIFSRFWYLVSIAVTIGVIAVASTIIYLSHAPVAEFLSRVALCSTSWSHGQCPW